MKEQRREHKDMLLFDSGDFSQEPHEARVMVFFGEYLNSAALYTLKLPSEQAVSELPVDSTPSLLKTQASFG